MPRKRILSLLAQFEIMLLCDKIHHLVKGVFQKTYVPNEFNELDNHIFGDLRTNAENKIQAFL